MALSKIDIANMLTGVTPVANGGTGLASGTTDQFLKFTGSTTVASAAVPSGLTGAQTFRPTGNTTVTTGADTLITNWEEIDEPAGQGVIGSSVSHSAGTFTIAATGIWLVTTQAKFEMTTTNRYFGLNISYTTDAWSSTQSATNPSGSSYRDSGTYYQGDGGSVQMIDVTDTTNYQVRLNGSCEQTNGAEVTGSSASTQSWVQFLRLGDT